MRGPRKLALACLCASLPATSCFIPSNVVASTDRAVVVESEHVTWRAGTAEDLPGLWLSSQLEGPAATALHQIAYFFTPDGQFTGAALFVGPPPEYRVLSGTWRLDASNRLELGAGAEPATLEAAPDLLRISGPDGAVVLRREVLR